MVLNINRQELTIDADSETITVRDLLKYLEINFRVIVEKNGMIADKGDEIGEGDDIQIIRFAGGG